MAAKRGPPRRPTSVNNLGSASLPTRVSEIQDNGTHTTSGSSAHHSPPLEPTAQEEVLPSQTSSPTQDQANLQQEEYGPLPQSRAKEIIRCCTIEGGRSAFLIISF